MDKVIVFYTVISALVLSGCPVSMHYEQSEPCFIAYEEDQMSEPALCSVDYLSEEPCLDIALCLCEFRDLQATEDEFDRCVETELITQNSQAIASFCGTDLNLSLGEVLRIYSEINDASLSLSGPCDSMPTLRDTETYDFR